MGLDVYISYPDPLMDEKSDKHPDHLCTKAYLRSSYNDGGFNSVVRRLLNKDWYWVFGIEFGGIEAAPGYVPYDEETDMGGEWIPTNFYLEGCRRRAEQLVEEMKAVERPLRCTDVTAYDNAPPKTAEEAIALVSEKLAERKRLMAEDPKKHEMWGGSYSSADGLFSLDNPMPVIALVNGKNVLGMPCVHVVYEATDFNWYIQAAEITVELIETMIDNPGASISWSA